MESHCRAFKISPNGKSKFIRSPNTFAGFLFYRVVIINAKHIFIGQSHSITNALKEFLYHYEMAPSSDFDNQYPTITEEEAWKQLGPEELDKEDE